MRKVVLIYDKDAAWFAARLTGPYAFLTAETGAQALLLAPQAQILLALAPRVTPALLAAMPGLLAAMPGLEWVQALTTGTDTLAGLGVTVTSARGIHGPQMAELALVLMLSAARRFPAMLDKQRAAVWQRWPQPLLQGKTVCLLGLGVIAEAVAQRAAAFGMQVTGVSDGRSAVPGFARIFPRMALVQAAAEADFLVVIVPYAAATHHIVNAGVLAAMRPTAHLINIARGGCVDEAALLACLDRGAIAGAALDVFATEPLPQDSAFWHHPRVMVTPHIGGMSDCYAEQVRPLLIRNLTTFATAAPLENLT